MAKMKTVMFDSSVYLSMYLKDINFGKAKKLINYHKKRAILLVPNIVFAEVVNVLCRAKINSFEIELYIAELLILSGSKILNLPKSFLIKKLKEIAIQAKLKSSDLLIMCFALKYKPNSFISFDNKLNKAYKRIINLKLYEKNKSKI